MEEKIQTTFNENVLNDLSEEVIIENNVNKEDIEEGEEDGN